MRKLLIFLLLAVFAAGVLAQPKLPHRVYGQVTDGGTPVQGVNVTVNCNDCRSATNSDGFYDLDLSGGEFDSGERIYLYVSGQNTSRYVNFTAGASERIDLSGGYSVPDQEQDNTTDDSPSGGGSSGGGGGGAGGSSGGGGGPLPAGSTMDQELTFEVSLDSNGSATVDMGELQQGQVVNVRVTGEDSYLEGFSFKVGSDSGSVSADVFSRSQKPSPVSKPDFDVFRYYIVDLSGLDQYSNAAISYQLSKPWLVSRTNSSEDFVFARSDGSWERIGGSVVTETLSVYSLESGVSSFGRFASGVETSSDSVGGEVSVTELSVESSDVDPFQVSITAEVVNNGNSSVSRNLTLYSGSRRLEVADISLGPGQSQVFSFSSNLSAPGPHSFRFGGKTATVTVEPSDQQDSGGLSLFLLIGGGVVFVLFTSLVAYVYFIEYKRAKELDETVEYLESQSDRVGQRMRDVREDLNRMQSQLGRRSRDQDNRDQR